jgi:hypothetical protein
MEKTEVKLCEPCFQQEPALAAVAYHFPSGVPMCDGHYALVCKVCLRDWARLKQLGNGHCLNLEICEACEAAQKREQARRDAYNQHLGSKQWWKIKKALRRESRREHGSVVCSRCGMTELDNKQLYGEGLHGHHATYERFGQEKTEDVELLCSRCHAWEHHLPSPKPLRNYDLDRLKKAMH